MLGMNLKVDGGMVNGQKNETNAACGDQISTPVGEAAARKSQRVGAFCDG